MIGTWQRFGEGEPPRDGEALVYIRDSGASIIDALEGSPRSEVVFAIHRYGMLHEQSGSSYSAPYGCLWTSIPRLPL